MFPFLSRGCWHSAGPALDSLFLFNSLNSSDQPMAHPKSGSHSIWGGISGTLHSHYVLGRRLNCGIFVHRRQPQANLWFLV
jgi:hypothetical protein